MSLTTTSEPYTTDATSPTMHVRYPSSSRISAALNSSDSLNCSIPQSTGKSITAVRGGREGEGEGKGDGWRCDGERENGREVWANTKMKVKVVEICSRMSTERQDRID